jgi:hypothetical protein
MTPEKLKTVNQVIMRKLPPILILIMIVLSASTFLPIQEVKASTWLFYDDGVPEGGVGGPLAVKYSLPSGWTKAYIYTIKFYIHSLNPTSGPDGPHTFESDFYDSDGKTKLPYPSTIVGPLTSTGWLEIDVTSKNIEVSGDFYVSYVGHIPNPMSVAEDTENRPVDTYYWNSGTGQWTGWGNIVHAFIRVEVSQDPPPTPTPTTTLEPVSGLVMPTNKLEILTPYIALVGLIIAVSSVYVIKTRKD